MNIRVRSRQDTLMVRVDGHLTESAAAELLEQLHQELLPQPRDIVLDLSGVESMSASALPYVFRIQKVAAGRDSRLFLSGRSAAVQRLLEKTQVLSALEEAENEASPI